jgi:hypothetical protein
LFETSGRLLDANRFMQSISYALPGVEMGTMKASSISSGSREERHRFVSFVVKMNIEWKIKNCDALFRCERLRPPAM